MRGARCVGAVSSKIGYASGQAERGEKEGKGVAMELGCVGKNLVLDLALGRALVPVNDFLTPAAGTERRGGGGGGGKD